jgi:hypothetical protein
MNYRIITQQTDAGENVFAFEDTEQQKMIPLNSLYSPMKEAERFLKKIDFNNKLTIIIGFGNGTVFRHIIDKHLHNQAAHIIFLEPFNAIPFPNEQPHKKFSFIHFDHFSKNEFANVFRQYLGVPTEVFIHPNYQKTNTTLITKIIKELQESIEIARIFNNTELLFSLDWIIEPLINLKYTPNLSSLEEYKNAFQNEKAVLVASGPSLKEHIETIKKLQPSAYVFAAGSAVNGLLNNGITPDFVTIIDASIRNFKAHFQNSSYNGPLIAETTTNSNIIEHHQGDILIVGSDADHVTNRYVDNLLQFSTSPSVALFTLKVIYYLGFKEVYLIGQDLSLIDGKYYAKGVHEHDGLKSVKVDAYVESNSGEMVGTTRSLNIFREAFEREIENMKDDITIYNLSENGAKIKGTLFLQTNEISAFPLRREIMLELSPKKITDQSKKAIYSFIQELKDLISSVQKARHYYERLLETAAISPDDMKKVLSMFKKTRQHDIFENVILYQLSFVFNKIVNTFKYFETKPYYSNEERLKLLKELHTFMTLVEKYCHELLNNKRIQKLLDDIQ